MNKIDYRAEVMKVYPDAKLENRGAGYVQVISDIEFIGHAHLSTLLAWKSAYKRIKEKAITQFQPISTAPLNKYIIVRDCNGKEGKARHFGHGRWEIYGVINKLDLVEWREIVNE